MKHAHALLAATVLVAVSASIALPQAGPAPDILAELQGRNVATKNDILPRPYHFGSQGPGATFTNHTGHSNRMVPVYAFGKKVDLGAVTGANSPYRTEEGIHRLFGRVPALTLNPQADYGDQADLYRVQKDAVSRGVKHLFILWFDGLDWETTQAAAIARTGRVYTEGKGAGLLFQDYQGAGPVQFGYVVTAPTHNDPPSDLVDRNAQTLGDLSKVLGGGYDPRLGGPTPWTPGEFPDLRAAYLRGQSASKSEMAAVLTAGGVQHAYTDSAPSAAEFATGVKQPNDCINVCQLGKFHPTLFNQLQANGWKVGTVTSVAFPHASPAAMYAHNVCRDDYQDLAREMLGLDSIVQQTNHGALLPGLDVVIGAGWGITARESDLAKQGSNAVAGNPYITAADLAAIDVRNGGNYVVAQRTPGRSGRDLILESARQAAQQRARLFGFFGTRAGHLPYRTANGDYQPVRGQSGVAERYQPADLLENPTLADMTSAALEVLTADPSTPFALFVEAGDVDFALHDNNLDNAIGAIHSGEDALRTIFDWVERHSSWDDAAVIVTSDHGHLLVIDDPQAIAAAAHQRASSAPRSTADRR
jgi:alkaline phosphatase